MPIEESIELYDKNQDTYYLNNICIEKGNVVIIEGVFLQRKELRDYFSYIIYIDIPQAIRLKRVISRDTYIGNEKEIIKKYQERYFPAEEIYCSKYSPRTKANYIKTT